LACLAEVRETKDSMRDASRDDPDLPENLLSPAPAPEDLSALLRPLPYRPSLLERFAVRYLSRRAATLPQPVCDDPVHLLTPAERAQINRVVRNTVIRSCLAGLLSAAVVASVDIALHDAPEFSRYAALALTGLCTVALEVFFLYRAHLFAVLSLSRAAGADIFQEHESLGGALVSAMGRAALELPDPSRVVEGIDPRRETSKIGLVLAVGLYKFKRSLTSFLLKLLLRQIASRGALRTFAPMIALPVSGLWNALVSYRILREARMRVLGPSAVVELRDMLFAGEPPLTPEGRVMLLRAVGVAIVRKRTAHPNLLAWLRALAYRIGSARAEQLDHSERFLAGLPRLGKPEQFLVLQALQLGAILDGSLSARERQFLRRARVACGLSPDLHAAEALLHRFSTGDPITAEQLEALVQDPPEETPAAQETPESPPSKPAV
jgi:hypothetical protein